MDQQSLLPIIDTIHRASLDPQIWPDVLHEVTRALGGSTAALLHHQLNGHLHGHIRASSNVWLEPAELYNSHYAAVDPWAMTLSRQSRLDRDFVVTSEELVPFNEFQKTEYYTDFARRYGFVRNVAVGIATVPGVATTLSVLRPENAAPFGDEQRRILYLLQPHIRTAFAVHRQLSAADLRTHSMEAALNSLSTAVLILRQDGRVEFANAAAVRLAAAQDGFNLRADGPAGASTTQTAKLRRAVAQAMLLRLQKSTTPIEFVRLERPSSKEAFVVWATPVPHTPMVDLVGAQGSVLLFITDPASDCAPSTASLQRAFGFTPAEARLALQLVRGDSLDEAASTIGVTINSARWTVKQLLRKTNSKRQQQLVRKLVTALASMVTPSE